MNPRIASNGAIAKPHPTNAIGITIQVEVLTLFWLFSVFNKKPAMGA